MEKTEEKLEHIEELLELFITRSKTQQEQLDLIVARQIPNYEKPLSKILEVLANEEHAKNVETISKQLQLLVKNASSVPNVIPVRHHHNFDLRSRPYFIGAAIVFVTMALSFGGLLFLGFRRQELRSEAEKFRVVRGSDLSLALAIDSLYLQNRESLMEKAETRILEREQLLTAQAKELKARTEYEKAKGDTKKLRAKFQKNNF
ncbi:hypothetical protein ACVWYG_001495 [Pedobacter sp. UYEF25]